MADFSVIPISSRKIIGEGPHWVERDNALIFVDIRCNKIYRYFQDTGRQQVLYLEDVGTGDGVSFIIPLEGSKDKFVVGVGRSVVLLQWSADEPDFGTRKLDAYLTVDSHDPITRFNDGKCDAMGRLWAGTMHDTSSVAEILPERGSLYRIGSDLKAKQCVDKVTLSNGLDWSLDRKTFYYIDTMKYRVDAFDYNETTGDLGTRKTVLDFKSSNVVGFPDGMTTDVYGNLWVACFGGNQVICLDPAVGKVVRSIKMPASMITSCCWGGKDYSTLYVTSGSVDLSEEEATRLPNSGNVFAVTGLGVKGMAPNEFKLNPSLISL